MSFLVNQFRADAHTGHKWEPLFPNGLSGKHSSFYGRERQETCNLRRASRESNIIFQAAAAATNPNILPAASAARDIEGVYDCCAQYPPTRPGTPSPRPGASSPRQGTPSPRPGTSSPRPGNPRAFSFYSSNVKLGEEPYLITKQAKIQMASETENQERLHSQNLELSTYLSVRLFGCCN